uniref:TFIIS N-terminal domain-containing protein n=1 Tax=Kalanchoe fedtschenkoi TaxID=63787 RepID=A0A7N0TNR9_KALFE
MDCDDFRSMLETSGTDVWEFIDTAITVASMDYGDELKNRRDSIVEKLYRGLASRCRNCDRGAGRGDDSSKYLGKEVVAGNRSPLGSPQSLDRDDYDDNDESRGQDLKYGGDVDDEQVRILDIKDRLEDVDQSEEIVVDLLQSLADMDITFKALKDTDIGRHVNRLRKHPSNEVRRLVKHLVRKWKDLVDQWVIVNSTTGGAATSHLIEGDSPQQKLAQNGHYQVPDFVYSPNPHNGSSGSEKNNPEQEFRARLVSGRGTPPTQRVAPNHVPPYTPPNKPKPKDDPLEADRLASARKRLQENYKEAENAKKQRTIQMMDIHEIPKPKSKNAFFAKNKGGSHGGRHW